MRTIVYYLLLVAVAFSVLPGCGDDYDDTALREELSEQAERIAALEAWQSSVNTNISSLQGLVAALEAKDYVTGVVPVVEGGTTVGYTISFTKSSPITIYHGSTGSTGSAPEIGVAQYTDGRYYWTLNGEWIIDADGAMIPTTGNDGQNGQDGSDGKDGADGWDGQTGTTGKTPKVIIGTDGYWYISPDGTATGTPPDGTGWQSTNVKATGDKGEQGDAIFDKDGVNNDNEDYVEFTLADGNTITLPKYKTIGISFTAPEAFTAGENKEIPYTSTGTVSPTNIRVIDVPEGWAVEVDIEMQKIKILPPEYNDPQFKGGEATVLVADQNRVVGMYGLTLRNQQIASNTVGAEYFENGELKGYVYKVNNGSADSGLIIHLVEVGVFTYTGADTGTQSIELRADITGEEILEKIQTLNNWEELKPWLIATQSGAGWFVGSHLDLYVDGNDTALYDLISAYYSINGAETFQYNLGDEGSVEFFEDFIKGGCFCYLDNEYMKIRAYDPTCVMMTKQCSVIICKRF